MHALPVDLSVLRRETGASTVLEGTIEIDVLTVGDEEFAFVAPISFSIDLTNAGHGILTKGTVSVRAETTCVRCLESYGFTLTSEVDTLIVRSADSRELPEEQDVEIVDEDQYDLEPLLLSALAVQAPFAPVCREDCPGLCARCGAAAGSNECACAPEEPDSPFAVLKDLFDGEDV
jgi:uncharacterized protein